MVVFEDYKFVIREDGLFFCFVRYVSSSDMYDVFVRFSLFSGCVFV